LFGLLPYVRKEMNYSLFLGGGARRPANAPIAAEPMAVRIVGTPLSLEITLIPINTITPIIIIY
jgi:hypothetical protein